MKSKKLKELRTKIPKVKLPIIRRKSNPEERFQEAVQTAPKITNDTVAEHREAVLGSARKFIYPLQYSKHRIVLLSIGIFGAAVIAFFSYCMLELYRFQSTSSFIYAVTQVIPFPVAKAGSSYVEYENYLFEVRRYMHYYQTQQQIDFNSSSGKAQLNNFKQQAMTEVTDYAYVKQLAAQYHITVTTSDLNNEISVFQSQNRLGNSQQELKEVLSEFWGWSIPDFKRELQQLLLAQKVVAKLDTATQQRAQAALTAIENGANFSTVAQEYSDDATTKTNGGEFGFTITKDTQNLPPQTISTLLRLKPSQYSGIVNIGNSLEIDEVISNTGGQIQAAHILFNFQSINTYIQPLESKHSPHIYIHLASTK